MAVFSTVGAAVASAASAISVSTVATQLATSVALGAVSSALRSSRSGAAGQEPRISREVSQGVTNRRFILGRYGTAGSYIYRSSMGIGSDDPTENYVVVYALSDLPVRGLSAIWVDGVRCTVDGSAGVDPVKGVRIPELADDEDDGGQIKGWFRFHDGTQTEADEYLVNRCSLEDYPWESTAVGHGIAYIVMTFDYDPNLYQGYPECFFELEGLRLNTPVSEHLVWDLPAAQTYSLLSGISYNGRWFYGSQRPPVLPEDDWSEQITLCDQPVPGAASWSDSRKREAFGSTQVPAQFLSGLEVDMSRSVADNISEILKSMDGYIVESGGRYRVRSGAPPETADFVIRDEDITTTEPQSFSPFPPLAESINSVSVIYPSRESGYEDQEPDPITNEDFEREDMNRRLSRTLRLDSVTSGEQAQRVGNTSLRKSRRARRHRIVLPPEYCEVEAGDTGVWTTEENFYENKLFFVESRERRPNCDIALDILETDPTDYSPRDGDFRPVRPSQTRRVDPRVFSVPGFSVDQGSNPRRPDISMSWDAGAEGQRLVYRVFRAGTDTEVTANSVEYSEGRHTTSDGIAPGEELEVQVRRVMRRGRTPWSPRYAVTTPSVLLGMGDLSEEIRERIQELVEFGEGQEEELAEYLSGLRNRIDEAQNDAGTALESLDLLAESRENLVLDPRFERDRAADRWRGASGTHDVRRVSTGASSRHGAQYCGRATVGDEGQLSVRYSRRAENLVGGAARLGSWVRCEQSIELRVTLITVDASGAFVKFTDADRRTIPGNTWVYVDGTTNVSSGAYVSDVVVFQTGPGEVAPGTRFYWTNTSAQNVSEAADIRARLREDYYSSATMDEAAASLWREMDAEFEGGGSSVTDISTAMSSAGRSMAARVSSVEATYGDMEGAIENLEQLNLDGSTPFGQLLSDLRIKQNGQSVAVRQFSSVLIEDGEPAALMKMQVEAGGSVAGISIFADGDWQVTQFDGLAVFNDRLESASYDGPRGASGFQLNQTGPNYFNGPVISRQLQVATGTRSIDHSLSITGDSFDIEVFTGFDAEPWTSARRSIIPSIGLQEGGRAETRSSVDKDLAYWEWQVVDFRSRIGWNGDHQIVVTFRCRTFQITRLQGILRWRLYEVT